MSNMSDITPESLIAILDSLKADYFAVIDQLDLNTPISAAGDWNVRQVLSHIIGSLNRTPIHVGYYLANASYVPITFSDPYWIEAWYDAPLQAFKAAFEAAIEGNKALVRGLPFDAFWRVLPVTAFGELPLGAFLMVNYNGHIRGQHLHQLRAFIEVVQPA